MESLHFTEDDISNTTITKSNGTPAYIIQTTPNVLARIETNVFKGDSTSASDPSTAGKVAVGAVRFHPIGKQLDVVFAGKQISMSSSGVLSSR
jgi:hypothetical protein